MKGDAPVLLSAMYDLVLLHKSTCLGLGKAQILIKRKKFFPIHLPKSSFEGMRGSFCVRFIPDFIFQSNHYSRAKKASAAQQ